MGSVLSVFREGWAISPSGLELIIAIASRDKFFIEAKEKALAARDGKPLNNSRITEKRGDVAVVTAQGPMFRHADMFTEISGATSYAAIRKDLQAAIDDPSVSSVLLNIDSPGGEVNGCAELAAAIRSLSSVKPIIAYVGGQACSAAYWLASATSKIVISPTAQLGSIGVCASYSKDDEKTIDIVSTQSPNKNADPATDRGRALVQERLDALADVFIESVALYRGVSAKKVQTDFGRGDVFVGAKVIAVGMADKIADFESALSEVSKRGTAANQKRLTMEENDKELVALQAFALEVMALVGAKDRSAAMGALHGIKAKADQSDAVSAELAAFKVAAAQAEVKSLLDEATRDGRIKPAARAEFEALNAKHGLEALKACLSMLPKAASAAVEPKEDPAAVVSASGLTADQLKILRLTGITPEKFAEHKKVVAQIVNPTEEN